MSMNSTVSFLYDVTTEPSANITTSYNQSVGVIVLWSALYITMMITALFGNFGICWLVIWRQKLRTVTNFFLSSTAFADSLIIVLNTVFNFTFAMNGNRWVFGRGFCHFINFLPIGAVCASIFFITVISIDRFILVIFPMRQRIRKQTALLIILTIWILALLIALPQSYFSSTKEQEGRIVCFVQWPNELIKTSYQILFTVLTYWLPLLVLTIAYLIMGIRLGKNKDIIVGNETQIQRKKKNRKAVRMMVLVVAVFAVCWLPYQVFFVATVFRPGILSWGGVQHLYLGVFWLAMSHAMYNPIIYCWANPRFRNEFFSLMTSSARRRRDRKKNRSCSHRYTSSRNVVDDRTLHTSV